jgi:signal recognition particle GTPase
MDRNEVKDDVEEILRSYEIPAEYVEQVISEVKKRVKSKLQGLPDEDWLTEILSKLYIRITYEMLRV